MMGYWPTYNLPQCFITFMEESIIKEDKEIFNVDSLNVPVIECAPDLGMLPR